MIYSTAHPDAVRNAQRQLGRAESAALLERAFAILATALHRHGVRTFVVAGGETSGAAIDAIGVKMLGVGKTLEPGVPWAHSLDPPGLHLALKSGHCGGADCFLRALGMKQ